MELQAVTCSVGSLLTLDKRYLVPRFQREYSWEKEEIQEFWEDISEQIDIKKGKVSNSEYFIGCIVLVGEDSKQDYLIVDGQQRLTTLTVLLRAIVKCLGANGDSAGAEALFANMIEGVDNDGKKYFKLVVETTRPYFQNEIQSLKGEGLSVAESDEEKRLLMAYELFEKNLNAYVLAGKSKIDSLKAVREQVLNFLKFILVTAKSEEDAYTIFETLNARGMSLTSVDLIKNWAFKNFNTTHPHDNAREIWSNVRKSIEEFSDLEMFFRHYWNSKFGNSSNDRLYKSFNEQRKKGQIPPARDFLLGVKAAAQIYRKIGSPLETDWPALKEKAVYRALLLLTQHKVTQVRPFLLALVDCRQNKLITQSAFIDMVVNLEKFHFLFSRICRERASGLENKYARAAKDLYAAGTSKVKIKNVLKDLNDDLIAKIPKGKRIRNALSEIEFSSDVDSQRRTIQIIFSKIEKHLLRTAELQVGEFSIEHVRDQSFGDAWGKKIGNLIPLDEKLNNELKSGSSFKQKSVVYQKSNLKIVKKFLAENPQSTWGAADVNRWEESLADMLERAAWLKAI